MSWKTPTQYPDYEHEAGCACVPGFTGIARGLCSCYVGRRIKWQEQHDELLEAQEHLDSMDDEERAAHIQELKEFEALEEPRPPSNVYEYTDDFVCPYCGYKNDPDYEDREGSKIECGGCQQTYILETIDVSYSYTTKTIEEDEQDRKRTQRTRELADKYQADGLTRDDAFNKAYAEAKAEFPV